MRGRRALKRKRYTIKWLWDLTSASLLILVSFGYNSFFFRPPFCVFLPLVSSSPRPLPSPRLSLKTCHVPPTPPLPSIAPAHSPHQTPSPSYSSPPSSPSSSFPYHPPPPNPP